jgi:Tol biopolymer transport system component
MKATIAIITVGILVSISCGLLPSGLRKATPTPQYATTFPELPPRTAEPESGTPIPDVPDEQEYSQLLVAFAANGWCVPGSNREIFTMQPDGSGIKCITNSRGDDYDPSWSPDGRKIVFISERTGNNDVFVMNADGSNQVQLTFSTGDEHWPAFSPDGQRIAFALEVEGMNHLFVMALDGVEEEQLFFPDAGEVNCKYPDWSPDGQWLVFSCFGGNLKAGIYKSHPDGSDLTLLKAGALHNPVWSPDGKLIALDGEPAGCKFEVYVMKSDGSGMKQVTENPEGCGGYSKHPTWSPDGKKLIFNSQRTFPDGVGYELFSINLDGSGETQLTDSSKVELYRSPFDAVWSHGSD